MFLLDEDQNLKYMGLYIISKMLLYQPGYVALLKDVIIGCFDHPDISIRYKTIDILCLMVTPKNIKEIVKRMMIQLGIFTDLKYQTILVQKILEICDQDTFAHVSDFEWLTDIYSQLVTITNISINFNEKLLNLAVRVPSNRSYYLNAMSNVLSSQIYNHDSLYGIIWPLGEYCS